MAETAPLTAIPQAPVPPGGAAEWFTGAGGLRLRAALFRPQGEPRGSVVVSGGRTEPIEKYFEVIAELLQRGFVVLAHDWRGQGLSARLLPDPLKGHADGYADFLADYRTLIETFADRLPGPRLAIGHSMGGCLTFLALAQGQEGFSGAVLSAPMLGLHTGGTPRPVGKALAAVFSAVGLGGMSVQGRTDSPIVTPFEDNILTHDRARYDRNQAQVVACPGLALGGPTWGWLHFAFSAIGELETGPGAPRIAIPLTVLGAGDDRLVDITGQRRVTARVPGSRFVEVPGAYHEILQETDERRAVFWREFDAVADKVAPARALAQNA